MKNKLLILLVIVGAGYMFYGQSYSEYYNTWTGEIVCSENCWHEIGHKMDHENGWISQSEEYKIAVDGIIDKDRPLSINYLFNREFGLYAELYAETLNLVDGNISKLPSSLQPFYLIGREQWTHY